MKAVIELDPIEVASHLLEYHKESDYHASERGSQIRVTFNTDNVIFKSYMAKSEYRELVSFLTVLEEIRDAVLKS